MDGPFFGASFVWIDSPSPRRSEFVLFVREFTLLEAPSCFPLRVFADSRYRLRVNGKTIAHGPGRFVTQHPEYDEVDLAPYLNTGHNRVEVEACFYGASSYQTMPDGEAAFIASGGSEEVDMATPGSWEGLRVSGCRSDAPAFSFAQGPVEIRDLRVSPEPAKIKVVEGPWGPLKPYSGTPLPLDILIPKRVSASGKVSSGEERIGFMAEAPLGQRPWTAFGAWLHSPKVQTVTVSCFWSELALNGRPIKGSWPTALGNHGTAVLDLREGWNLLTGEVEVLAERWAYLLGVPRGSGVTCHSRRAVEAPGRLAVAPVGSRSQLFLPGPAADGPPEGWREVAGDLRDVTPARVCGWDEVSQEGVDCLWTYTFEGEVHGHFVLDVEGPAGTIVDVAVDDWLRPDGLLNLYKSNPFTDSADRFILSGGRQTVELFHARGGKAVQVVLRHPEGTSGGALHGLWALSRQGLAGPIPEFSCSDPVLTWAWKPSLQTLASSVDDTYADCPWRERGAYIGDSLVNLHVHLLLTSDLRATSRTLRIFAQAQREDGQLPGVAPAWLRAAHEDYTLQWILALHDYWAHSGDVGLVGELWPTVKRIWESEAWKVGESGLWDLSGTRCFVDWGVLPSEREGEGHAGINILRVKALRHTARLASALGLSGSWEDEADDVESLLWSRLWDEERSLFRPALGQDTLGLHANVWALYSELGTPEQRQRIIKALEPTLRSNLERGLEGGNHAGHLELFFLFFLLEPLAKLGRADLAEDLIRDHYGFLQALGDDTLPECFCRVQQGEGSRCHSWSGAAAVYAARCVLGIRPEVPGDPDRFLWQPLVHGITRASGSLPHPRGRIRVSWRAGEEPHLEAPDGVVIRREPKP